MTKFKGIVFPSWKHSQLRTFLKEKKQYVGFSDRRARIRYMRQQCRDIVYSKDLTVIEAFRLAVQVIPDEYMLFQFIYKAKKISERDGINLIEAMNLLLEKFAELKEDKKDDGVTDRSEDEGTVGETD